MKPLIDDRELREELAQLKKEVAELDISIARNDWRIFSVCMFILLGGPSAMTDFCLAITDTARAKYEWLGAAHLLTMALTVVATLLFIQVFTNLGYGLEKAWLKSRGLK